MLTVGIVLDTDYRKGRNLDHIVTAFKKKMENWSKMCRSNPVMPTRDKLRIVKNSVLPKALYGTELTLNWTSTRLNKINASMQGLIKDI